jgi:hypothetical protein
LAFKKEASLKEERGEQTLAIIPLNLDGFLFERNGEHAVTLRKRLIADFTGWDGNSTRFEEQLAKVVQALRTDNGGPEPPPDFPS